MKTPLLRVALALGVAVGALAVASDVTAQEAALAFTLASGANIGPVQERVTALQNKAIARRPFSEEERAFLHDLYAAMAAGAKASGVLAQSGRMMDRYLDKSGDPLELDAAIFSGNARVRREIERLARRMASRSSERGHVYRSERFYMPDRSSIDSVTGLYWGTLSGQVREGADGRAVFHYRAEVPWRWPSYASLQQRYGTPHAETFALPNLRSVLEGEKYALHVENGLGEYLVQLGLAKPFLAWAEWDEPVGER
jgi:hypothetical protein